MRKSLIALATAATCSYACASNVEIYGAVDAYVAVNNDSGTVSTALSSGGSTGNYFGFQGSEDLWEGGQAVYKLEAGFLGDNGTYAQSFAGNTNRLFHREAWVGIRDKDFGQISFGRQYTPHFLTWAMTDVNGLSLGTAASPFFFPAPGFDSTMGENGSTSDLVRYNNSIFYASPNLGGATVMAFVGLGENKDTTTGKQSSTKDNIYNLAVNYANGPLFVMGSVLYRQLADRNDQTYYELAGSYDFGITKVAMQLEYKHGSGRTIAEADTMLVPNEPRMNFVDSDIYVAQLGATTPMFGGRLNTTVAYLHDADNDDRDGYSFGARFDYDLSKRTMVYVGVEAMINEDNAARSIEAGPDSSYHFTTTARGNDQQQFFVGMRHRF